ncbi:MAG TPA: PKD domain-containing protein, partial [Urbifossiella sp.]|nr:PKD domain-containing protein [Urbifossiella sp.]
AQGDIKFVLAFASSGTAGRLDKLDFGFYEPWAVTAPSGDYMIGGLAPGDYVIREVIPAGQHQTDPGPGAPVDGHPGVFFGAAYSGNTGQTQLAEVDAGTGKVTRIGTPMATRMHGLVLTNDGSLYGVSGFDNSLYGVNRTTGLTTRIGAAGMALAWGLTYDPATDTIYGLGVTNPAQNILSLVVLNRATGSAVAVGPGVAGLTGTSGLAFDAAGSRVLAFDNADLQLYSFDVMTGAGALLSVLPAGNFGWGLAYDGRYAVVGLSGGAGTTLAYFDPDTGLRTGTLTLSESAFVEALEFVAAEPLTRRVAVGPDETVAGVDFGNQSVLGSIRGTKFEDYDADGVRDPNEPGLGGVALYLDLNRNGVRDVAGVAEPDAFAAGQDLTTAVPGVTLNVVTSGTAPNPALRVRSNTDGFPTTGSRVFFRDAVPTWTTGGKLRAEFAQPVGRVSIDFAAGGAAHIGRLEAYNLQGQLVATFVTSTLAAGQAQTMTIQRAQGDIKFVLAFASSGTAGRLDNLRYGETEPVAVTDAGGVYAFVGLQPGDYVVRETVPPGYRQTLPGPGIANPGPGVLFGASYFGGTGLTQLTEIDPSTGRVTRIGGLMAERMHGLVVTNDGTLYGLNGFDPGSDGLYRIDRTTGQVTLVGRTGFDVVWGMTYDAATDTIYGVGQTAPGVTSLLKIDRATGAATVVGPGVTGLTGGSGMAFDWVHGRVLVFDNADLQLYAFDPVTGAGSLLSVLPAGNFGWGLAFDGQYAVVGLSGGAGTTLAYFDPDTGLRTGTLNLTEQAFVETLEFVRSEPFTRRVTLGRGEALTGADFGNKGPNRAPVAHAGGPYTVTEGEALTLDASASTDVEGGALAYAWDLDGDGQYDDATGVAPTLTWAQLVASGIADDGTYTIGLRVTDADPDGVLSATATAAVTVLNAAPTVAVELSQVAIGEGGVVTVTGTVTDPGPLDTHTVSIDWGDGSSEAVAVDPVTRSFTAAHRYLDDDPTGTPSDPYTITAVASDGVATGSTTAALTVNNAAPVVATVGNTALAVGAAAEGDAVTLTAAFTDAGTIDTHEAVVDWGDGTTEVVSVAQAAGGGSLAASHSFAVGGVYTITVRVTDDDTGMAAASTRAYVTGVGVHGGVLQVVGTAGADHLTLNAADGTLKVHAGFVEGTPPWREVAADGVGAVMVFLGEGDDSFTAAGNIALPLVVDGGAGDDTIRAGAGRSILVGGAGADSLAGGGGEDILIGGTTAFDGDVVALAAILAEWSDTTRTASVRLANLTDGSGSPTRANGTYFLTTGPGGTVQNDTDADDMTGKQDTDVYFADLTLDSIVLHDDLLPG